MNYLGHTFDDGNILQCCKNCNMLYWVIKEGSNIKKCIHVSIGTNYTNINLVNALICNESIVKNIIE